MPLVLKEDQRLRQRRTMYLSKPWERRSGVDRRQEDSPLPIPKEMQNDWVREMIRKLGLKVEDLI